MALEVRKDYYGLKTGIKTEQIYPACRLLSIIIGQPIPNNKAITGANAFAHESGIHQDGMLKHRETYEIMTPQSVGRKETTLVIGKHSGRNAVRSKFEALGYSLDDEQLNQVLMRSSSWPTARSKSMTKISWPWFSRKFTVFRTASGYAMFRCRVPMPAACRRLLPYSWMWMALKKRRGLWRGAD